MIIWSRTSLLRSLVSVGLCGLIVFPVETSARNRAPEASAQAGEPDSEELLGATFEDGKWKGWRVPANPDLTQAVQRLKPSGGKLPTGNPSWEITLGIPQPQTYRAWESPDCLAVVDSSGAVIPLSAKTEQQSLRRNWRPLLIPSAPAAPSPKLSDASTAVSKLPYGQVRELHWRYHSSRYIVLGVVEGVVGTFLEAPYPGQEWTSYAVRVIEDYRPLGSGTPRFLRIAWPGAHRYGGRPADRPMLRIGDSYLFMTQSEIRRLEPRPGVVSERWLGEQYVASHFPTILGLGLYRIEEGLMAPPFPEWRSAMLDAKERSGGLARRGFLSLAELEPRYGLPWATYRAELLALRERLIDGVKRGRFSQPQRQ